LLLNGGGIVVVAAEEANIADELEPPAEFIISSIVAISPTVRNTNLLKLIDIREIGAILYKYSNANTERLGYEKKLPR
jgi:hypothetical protein